MGTPQASTPKKRRRWLIAVIILVVLIVILVPLATIPVAKSYTFGDPDAYSSSDESSFQGSLNHSLCPDGATAKLSLSISDGLSATFRVVDPVGSTIWGPESASGSTSFTLSCGVYSFSWSGSGAGALGFSGTVDYSAPYLYPSDS